MPVFPRRYPQYTAFAVAQSSAHPLPHGRASDNLPAPKPARPSTSANLPRQFKAENLILAPQFKPSRPRSNLLQVVRLLSSNRANFRCQFSVAFFPRMN